MSNVLKTTESLSNQAVGENLTTGSSESMSGSLGGISSADGIKTYNGVTDAEVVRTEPEMIAVRRRSHRRRSKRPANYVDPRFRQIHRVLLVVVFALLVVAISGNSLQTGLRAVMHYVLGPLHQVKTVRIEVVALIVAAVILVYLTPGVEDYVLTFLGIRRPDRRSRR